ncbi:MAG: hypothetical protein J6W45_07870 [Bacteroidales bacterium]|nr:hypothetical protein [Bacteroidales bacterium]
MKISEKTQTYFENMGREIEQGAKFAKGRLEAYWSWWYSRNKPFIIEDGHLWCRDIPEFVDTMRQAGVKRFVTTNRSTDLMESLHSFAALGCTLEALVIVNADNEYDTDKQGIVIKL